MLNLKCRLRRQQWACASTAFGVRCANPACGLSWYSLRIIAGNATRLLWPEHPARGRLQGHQNAGLGASGHLRLRLGWDDPQWLDVRQAQGVLVPAHRSSRLTGATGLLLTGYFPW